MNEQKLQALRCAAEFMVERGNDASRGERELWEAIASLGLVIALLDAYEASQPQAQEKLS